MFLILIVAPITIVLIVAAEEWRQWRRQNAWRRLSHR
jgi:hypothetical protein